MKPAGHLIVISYDAFSEDHWEQAKRLPNLAKLIAGGMSTHKLRTFYPSLTYVVHSTISTGVYPARHGIYHNNPLQPFVEEKEQAWHWYRRDIKVPAIYDAAHEAGLKPLLSYGRFKRILVCRTEIGNRPDNHAV